MKRIPLMLTLLLVLPGLHAESRYVTDQFKITMRSGESTTHKIMRMLPSGTKLELLEENPESGYSKVRTQKDEIGYVLTRQLLKIPSARERLEKAEVRLQELQQEPGRLTTKLAQLQEKHEKLESEYKGVVSDKNRLQRELDTIQRTAADAIRIANERKALANQVIALTREVEVLKQKNTDLKDETRQKWFMIGAGVITGGIILGLLLPRLRFRRRRGSWDSL